LVLDDKETIVLGKSCSQCSIKLSIRNIIEVALTPAILNIASMISSALVNPNIFGKYTVDHVFIIWKNLFDHGGAALNMPISKILNQMIMEAIDDTNQLKEIEPKCIVVSSPLQTLQPAKTGKTPFLLGSLNTGMLLQVASTTYGLALNLFEEEPNNMLDMFCESGSGSSNCMTSLKNSHAVVIVHKGEIIPREGIRKVIYIKHNDKHKRLYRISKLGSRGITAGKEKINRTSIIILYYETH
jgi:hypothetical protein